MERLSLRLRIGLFFTLIALGGGFVVAMSIWVGYGRIEAAGASAAFWSAGIMAMLGLAGLVTGIWFLFDENVAKPIDALAAQLRVAPHARGSEKLHAARYLGDLAPAAASLQKVVHHASNKENTPADARAEQLLLDILSEIPVAVIVVNAARQIVLYDGQACEILERDAPARVGGALHDYFTEASVEDACARLTQTESARLAVTLESRSGRVYAGHICKLAEQLGYTFMLEALDIEAERPLTFDVGLLDAELSDDLAKTPLSDLTFVVFDTETTGLDAVRDDVVQLAAVRVLRGQIVPGERIDSLVNPGRAIPALATQVHRISDDMVADAPNFEHVCARFCSFATDAVVVAHNAPFDMAFINRGCAAAHRAFDPPVLDTVLMSAVVFGGAAQHTLDAICARMGIDIPEEARHTALGDAIATADALICMIRALESRGVVTYGDYQREAQKHRGLVKRTAASGA